MIDVVMITSGKRDELFDQSIQSLFQNAVKPPKLTIVYDGCPIHVREEGNIEILIPNRVGASAARNIGASSIPKYRRGDLVMFLDDDIYACPGWDEQLSKTDSHTVLSGYAHPFNHATGRYWVSGAGRIDAAGVLSTVCVVMPWAVWDDVGYWVEPGGPGGSEDYEWSMRALKKDYRLGVTNPQCVIHTGMTSSRGEKIVGYDLLVAQNERLLKHYGLEGKVTFA